MALEGLISIVFFGHHVARHGVVAESLSLHDTLHIGGPAVLGGDQDAGGLIDTCRNNNLLDFVTKNILDQLAEGLKT